MADERDALDVEVPVGDAGPYAEHFEWAPALELHRQRTPVHHSGAREVRVAHLHFR